MKIDTDTSRKDPIKDPKIEFRTRKRPEKRIPKRNPFLYSVPGMAWVQLEINQPQVVTAKCSGPQAVDSDVMGEGSGVAILLSARTETWLG